MKELVLPQGDGGERGGDGSGLNVVDGGEEFLTAEPAELTSRGVVGEQLEGDGGVVGGGNLTGFLFGRLDEASFHAAAFHAVGIVYVDAHHRATGLQPGVLVGDDGLAEGKDNEKDGEDAGGKDEQLAQVALTAIFVLQLLQHVHIAEVDFAVAAQLQEVDGNGDGNGCETNQE